MDFKRPVIFILVLLALGQSLNAGKLKRIKKAIQKEKFEKAEKLILKMLDKNDLNPGAKYFYSVMFSDTSYYRYDIDSARVYINDAYEDYQKTPVEDLKDLRKVDLTKWDFSNQKEFVASLAFHRAEGQMTLEAFEKFLRQYPEAENRPKAISYRDSLAFEVALTENTWQGYKDYFEKYPESAFVGDATDRYHILIFRDYTKDDDLKGYVRFLDDHPNTPFRKEAEEIIFKRSTIDHRWESYIFFLNRYPGSHLKKKAGDILYYKAIQSEAHTWEEVVKFHVSPDSLQQIHELNHRVLFPIAESGSFGFMGLDGTEVIGINYPYIPDHYLCGGITESWLEVGENGNIQAIARNGKVIRRGVEDILEVGSAVVLAQGSSGGLYHKSGYKITERSIDEARELQNGWIAVGHDSRWGLVTPAGYEVLTPELDAISTTGAFFVLEKNGLYAVTNARELLREQYTPNFSFDDYEVINDTLFQGFRGDEECLIDHQLNELLPLRKQAIYVSNSFWYKKDEEGYQIFDVQDQELIGQKFDYLEVNDGWLTLKKDTKWMLISRKPNAILPKKGLDSVKLVNDEATFIRKGDSLQVIFQNGKLKWLQPEENIQVLSSGEYEYLLFSSKGFQGLFDRSGGLLFETRYDQLTLLSDTLFKYKQKNKIGVITKSGKELIPAQYDVIDHSRDMIFLLRNEKIGGYDLQKRVSIPAKYDARIVRVGEHYQVQSNGKVGLVDAKDNELLPIAYEELVHWNDSAVWARSADTWKLLSTEGEVLKERVVSFRFWVDHPDESYAIILEKEGHGLVSNRTGTVLTSEYNEIINLGTVENPVIFAEQHLKTAAFFVVTYFNIRGEALRSQAFRPEEYDRIYCDQ